MFHYKIGHGGVYFSFQEKLTQCGLTTQHWWPSGKTSVSRAGDMRSSSLLGLVVKASASRAADLGLISTFATDLFPGGVIPVT